MNVKIPTMVYVTMTAPVMYVFQEPTKPTVKKKEVLSVLHPLLHRRLHLAVFVKHLGMELVHTAIVEINVDARVAIQDQQHGAKSQIQVVTKVVWSL